MKLSKRQGRDYEGLTKPQLIARLQQSDHRLDKLDDVGLPHVSEAESRQQTEHLLETITNALPVLISYIDSELRYRVCNKTYESWCGLPREKIIGRHLKDVIGNAAYNVIRGHVERALSGETVVYEDTLPYARGEVRNTHAHYQPDFDESGNVKGVFVSITDITELKNSEKALQELRAELETRVWQRTAELQNANDALEQKALEQEQWATALSESDARARSALQLLFTAIDSVSEHFLLVDSDDRLVMANEAWRTANASISDAVQNGTLFEDIMRLSIDAGLLPDAVGREQDWIEDRMAYHREPKGGLEIKRPDGGYVNVHEHKLADGWTATIATDITKRKQVEQKLHDSEQTFRGLLANSDQGFLIRQGSRIVYVNQGLADLFGYENPDEMLALDSIELLRPVHERGRIAKLSDARDRGDPAPPFYDFQGMRKDGSHFWIENRVQKITWQGTDAVLAAIIDASERKATEDQLRQAQKMEAVGQLTGGVAHDFNNLLSVILGNIELVKDDLDANHRAHVNLDTAILAGQRGAELVQSLLAFSRKQALVPQSIDINELVAGMADLLRRSLGETIDIETVVAKGLWICEADRTQVENTLLNLALNARDAMPGGGKLNIETANVVLDEAYAAANLEVKPGQYVLLSVTDTGIGMSDEIKDHVLEPFLTTKDIGAGSGLGLSMIYGFVRQSSGHVAIDSEVGKGTTFKIYLPRMIGADQRPADLATQEAMPLSRGESILVVEDDVQVRNLVATQLANLGYQVIEADQAADALERLDEIPDIDLMLIDIVLPGAMSGQDLAAEARRLRPTLNVLYMSGYAGDAMNRDDRPDDKTEMLQKPFSREDLAREIRAALDTE